MKSILICLVLFALFIDVNKSQTPEYEKMAKQIYDKITHIIGYDEASRPVLKFPISENPRNPFARYDPGLSEESNGTIYFETRALEVCYDLPKDKQESAVAFILAHELAHFLQTKVWLADALTPIKTHCGDERSRRETQADVFAAYIIRLIDFQPNGLLVELLTQLYTEYNICLDAPVGRNLECRASVTNVVCELAESLQTLHYIGNYLMAMGAYVEAKHIYGHLLQYVSYPEINNNAGLAALYAGISVPDRNSKWLPLQYPLLLDWDSPLRAPDGESRKELIAKAIDYFKRAAMQAPTDPDIAINLACAYDAAKDLVSLEQQLQSIEKPPFLELNNSQKQRKKMVKAILQVRKGEKDKAVEIFQSMTKDTTVYSLSKMAERNLQMVTTGSPPISTLPQIDIEDSIDGVSYVRDYHFNGEKHFQLKGGELKYQVLDQSTIFWLHSNRGIVHGQFTNRTQVATQKGIQWGSDLHTLRRKYGDFSSSQNMQHSQGYFIKYPEKGLLFNMNHQDKVNGWAIYLTEIR